MVLIERAQLPSIVDPVLPRVEPPAQNVERVRVIAQKSLFSDALSVALSFPCYIYRSVKIAIVNVFTAFIEEAKTILFRIYSLFWETYSSCVNHPATYDLFAWVSSFIVEDNSSAEKIVQAKQHLFEKTRTQVYNETAHTLSKYLIKYLRHSLDNAFEMHATVRPGWVSALSWQKPDGSMTFSLVGRLLRTYLKENEALVERYIELNILKRISCFVDIMQKVQSEKRFAFLDLLRGFIATNGKAHFYECNAKARHLAEHPPTDLELANMARDLQVLNGRFKTSFDVIAEVVMKMLFPQGEKDIELPMSATPASYLQHYLFELLKQEALPKVMTTGFSIATTEYAKYVIMLEGFKLLGKAVDQELHRNVPQLEIHYPQLAELSIALEDALPEIFDYGDPNFIPSSISSIAQKKLADKSADKMGEKLQTMTLQELVLMGLDKLLPALNDGGRWVEEEGQKRFLQQPFQFEITLDDKREKERQYQVKTERAKQDLTEYVASIGTTRHGIEQLFQYAVFGANSPHYYEPQQSSTVWEKISDFYHRVTKQVAATGVSQMGLVERLGRLNQALLGKMMRPEHHKLYIEFAQAVLELFGQRAPFPDLQDPRYKKENN